MKAKRALEDGLVSVIMPCFNAAGTICDSIQSVIDQTYTNLELLIVDDSSTDHSREIILEMANQDERIKFFTLDGNNGAAAARNYGIKKAQGRYIAFLDSDDLWKPQKLAKHIHFMQTKNIAFTFSSYEMITEDDFFIKIVKVPQQMNYKGLLKNTIIGCLTVVIDRNIIGEFKMPLIRTRQDTATWLSILKQGYTAFGLQEVLASYRVAKGTLSSKKFKMLKANWQMYRQVEKLSVLYTIDCFTSYVINAIKKRII